MQQLDVEEVAEEMAEVDAEMVAVLAVEVAAAVVVNFISHLKVHRSHYLIIDQKRTIIL